MNNAENNLDWIAAKHAQAVIKDSQHKDSKAVENTVTKALGVLQEDGVYACFLYLLAKEQPSKEDKKKNIKSTGEVLVNYMLELLDNLKIDWDKPKSYQPEDILSFIVSNEKITLERLLLTKEILEQMLIYARYGAKARQEDKEETS
ncbi:hypothetical protein VB711_08930 [Cronbergia sp. UHCC 0137]|uniref:hypothetical protein n=1 Tax=Cronbergia sp. UHCC 0137 TaxID=3110239 RepID=UPI002B1EC11D|nr:hypothetical protein [Cronbergia sp. UHCC 0137]MEA5617961.1 hypothetical protein [Cronbergia sp. UHCC 0137]